jgi:hypothetical protein
MRLLRVFENRQLRRIFESKRKKGIGTGENYVVGG